VHFVKPIGLANIPNDLLRLGDCLAFGFGALGSFRSLGGGSPAFLRSVVRAHCGRLSVQMAAEQDSANPRDRH
jgi:hypothetical protein